MNNSNRLQTILRRATVHAVALTLASMAVACGTAADEGDDSEGALAILPDDAPLLRAKIEECPKVADPSARLRCIVTANDDAVAAIDIAARSNGIQTGSVLDFKRQMDSFRDSEQWFCHARAGLAPDSQERSPAVDECLAMREISMAKVIVQTYYKYSDVKLEGSLTATCPKPTVPALVEDPSNTFLAGRELRSHEALYRGWAECYRTAVRDGNASKVTGSVRSCRTHGDNPPPGTPNPDCSETAVIDYSVNWALNICSGIANAAHVNDRHAQEMAKGECAVLSLYLLQQDIDRK